MWLLEFIAQHLPVQAAQTALQTGHLYSGLPWWCSIAATTVVLRSVFVTVTVAQVLKVKKAEPYIIAWAQKLNEEVRKKYLDSTPDQLTRIYRANFLAKRMTELKRHQWSPWLTYTNAFLQVPTFVSVSLALRKMSASPILGLDTLPEPVEGFTTGGFYFFENLTVPDPTMIFPLTVAGLTFLNAHLALKSMQRSSQFTQVDTRYASEEPVQTGVAYYFYSATRLMSPFLMVIATQVPVAISLYWTCSVSYSIFQRYLPKLVLTIDSMIKKEKQRQIWVRTYYNYHHFVNQHLRKTKK